MSDSQFAENIAKVEAYISADDLLSAEMYVKYCNPRTPDEHARVADLRQRIEDTYAARHREMALRGEETLRAMRAEWAASRDAVWDDAAALEKFRERWAAKMSADQDILNAVRNRIAALKDAAHRARDEAERARRDAAYARREWPVVAGKRLVHEAHGASPYDVYEILAAHGLDVPWGWEELEGVALSDARIIRKGRTKIRSYVLSRGNGRLVRGLVLDEAGQPRGRVIGHVRYGKGAGRAYDAGRGALTLLEGEPT